MQDITVEINRLINTLNAPALAFNNIAEENGFPMIPVIQNLDPEKLARNSASNETLSDLHIQLKTAGSIAAAYQQALSLEPRDRALINQAKKNYEEVRDNLVLQVEKINS
jgi:hypothetical protein